MDQKALDVSVEVGKLPRNWEHAFGYEGQARYVGFYWEPTGDESMYTDGRSSSCGNWDLFFRLREETFPSLQNVNLGHSGLEADHWLLLDRETRALEVLPRGEAERKLAAQWPRADAAEPELVALPEGYLEALNRAFARAMEQLNQEWKRAEVCPVCWQDAAGVPGWLLAEDGGFDRCPACSGYGFVVLVGD